MRSSWTFPPRQLTQDDRHGRVRGEDEGHVGGDAAAPDPDVGAGHLAAAAAPQHRAVVDADQNLGWDFHLTTIP